MVPAGKIISRALRGGDKAADFLPDGFEALCGKLAERVGAAGAATEVGTSLVLAALGAAGT